MRNLIRAITIATAAAAIAAPSAADAQRQFSLCSTDNAVCAGVSLSLTGSTLTFLLQNQGGTPLINSQITGFALYESPLVGGAMSASAPTLQYFDGTALGAVPAGFNVAAGAPPGLAAGAPSFQLAYNFTNDGLNPCGFGGTAGGGQVMLETCRPSGEYLQLTFANFMNATLDDIQVGVRFQSVDNQEGSYKCFSSAGINGNDCVVVPPGGGGGITGQVVPEPSTYLLLGSGLLGLAGVARRRSRKD